MKKMGKWIFLSGVILVYALLYVATSSSKGCDSCEEISRVDTLLRAAYPQSYSYRCHTNTLCISVNDSTQYNWPGLADTACLYLNNEGLQHYTVVIQSPGRDTLLKQVCP